MTKRLQLTMAAVVAGLLSAGPLASAQGDSQGVGRAIVTVMPKNDKAPAPTVTSQEIHVKTNGKDARVNGFRPLRGDQATVELVLLVDSGARTSLGREWGDIQDFVKSLPPNVKFAIAYMQNGGAQMGGPFTADRNRALQDLHLPMGLPGISASPYFCLSSLAKNWPSADRQARREVMMITDGVDYYHLQYDPDDPYVQSAIDDSVRAGLVVYSIYWRNSGRIDRTWYENDAGQNLLLELTQATGGDSYWQGMGNPESFQPYFKEFVKRLDNQYELGITAPLRGKAEVQALKIKVNARDAKVTSPQRVYVAPAEGGQQ